MTKAEILAYTRHLVNEQSPDSGALLDDRENLLQFCYDAAEQVVLDLVEFMPLQFCTTETLTLTANVQTTTFTAEYLSIFKVAKNVTDNNPKEIEIIDPLDEQFYHTVGETAAEPMACYFLGNTIYWVPKPSTTTAAYAKAYLVVPEAAAIPVTGPAYIPRVAHRLICYYAAGLAATMADSNPAKFFALYKNRLDKVTDAWRARFRSKPRFVKESVADRIVIDARESAFFDPDWR
jgi:hypothetical protein